MSAGARRAAGIPPQDAALLRVSVRLGVFANPPLAGIATARVDDGAMGVLQDWAQEVRGRLSVAPASPRWPAAPLLGLCDVALHELAMGTALTAQSRASGCLDVDETAARKAASHLRALAEEAGDGALLHLYRLQATCLNYRALHHYGEMAEEEFVTGRLHRPWCDWLLTEELRLGRAQGEIEDAAGGRIRLTPGGIEAVEALERAAAESGLHLARELLRESSSRDRATGANRHLRSAVPHMALPGNLRDAAAEDLGRLELVLEVGSSAVLLGDFVAKGAISDARAVCCGGSRGRLAQVERESGGRIEGLLMGLTGEIPLGDGACDLALLPSTPQRAWLGFLLSGTRRVLRPRGRLVAAAVYGLRETLPGEVLRALPTAAREQLAQQDAKDLAQEVEAGGFTVETSHTDLLEGRIGSGEALYQLLGEAGVLGGIERRMPIAAAERIEDEVFDACLQAARAAHGRLHISLSRRAVMARR